MLMENATSGDWLTHKFERMLKERVARVIRNGFGEVAIVIVKGRVTFLKTTEQEAVNEVESKKQKG